jgi:hypothetical protein
MELIQDDFLLANGTVFLLYQPILNTVAMMHMLTLENRNVLSFIDLIVAYATYLFYHRFLLRLWVLLSLGFGRQLLTCILAFGQ